MRGPFMFGMVVMLPLGVIGAVVGVVVGLLSGTWTLFWIGLAVAIAGPVFAFGSMALMATRLQSATNEFMTQQLRKSHAGGEEPLVGVEIPWKDIVRQVVRVTAFDRKATKIVDDQVINAEPNMPYGYLVVESPIFNQPVRMPLIHYSDFWLAASVLDDAGWVEVLERGDQELLATYAPRKVLPNGFSGDPTHCMHYVLCPGGTLARYYDRDEHMRRPAPEKLFGAFVYEGRVSVGVNQNPLASVHDA